MKVLHYQFFIGPLVENSFALLNTVAVICALTTVLPEKIKNL